MFACEFGCVTAARREPRTFCYEKYIEHLRRHHAEEFEFQLALFRDMQYGALDILYAIACVDNDEDFIGSNIFRFKDNKPLTENQKTYY
jgi:hypothetical protein